MNIRQKVTVVALLSCFVLASNPVKADVLGSSIRLPDLATVTAEVGKIITADLQASLKSAIAVPRVSRKRQPPTVTIQEMETVVVVATRLPPATESLAQVSTRTRL